MVWHCIPKNKEKGLDKNAFFPKSPQPGSLYEGLCHWVPPPPQDSAIGYLPHKQDAGLERDVDNRSRATFTLVWEESLTKQHVSRQDYRRQGGNPRKKMEAT